MAVRNGNEFIEGLRRKPAGRLGRGPPRRRRHQPIRCSVRPVQSIAQLYDLQVSPEHRDVMTYACEDTGELAGSFVPDARAPTPTW